MVDEDTFVVAIDGISGSGKSSTARIVAKELGLLHLDTGAMYRSLTYAALRNGLKPENEAGVIEIAAKLEFGLTPEGRLTVNGVTPGMEIRTPEVSGAVSDYCKIPRVREILVAAQRKLGGLRSCVIEGRDIGTVVFPEARFKFFMTARPDVRARRRLQELAGLGLTADFQSILDNLVERDHKDSTRAHSPLTQAADAIVIDTSELTFADQVAKLTTLVRNALSVAT